MEQEKRILNEELIEKYWKYIGVGISFKYFPIVIKKSKGCRIWDIEGREYIDFLTSAASFNIGHTNDEVVKAIKQAIDDMIDYDQYLYHEPSIRLAEMLVNIVPGSYEKKVLYELSGGAANDMALKVALAFTGRKYIGSFEDSYHGTHYLVLSSSGSFKPETRYKYNAYPYVYFFKYPDTFRRPRGIEPEEYG
ncbi:aminotransferase class III-fold pyridoxal phosphate-dependent enzyme, partial [Fervidicoccus sp.]